MKTNETERALILNGEVLLRINFSVITNEHVIL